MRAILRKTIGTAAASMLLGTVAHAADLNPPIIEAPTPPPVVEVEGSAGWYIRGDVGYAMNKMRGVDYYTASGTGLGLSSFDTAALSNNWVIGGGIGYDTGHYLRFDATVDYFTRSNFTGSTSGTCTAAPPATGSIACTTTDTATMSALALMANAYVDIGNFGGLRPYIGAGIGGTHVSWGDLTNAFNEAVTNPDEVHGGYKDWRFTYALMAGVSYDVTDCLAVDAGYRFRDVAGGKMIGIGDGGDGPGGNGSFTGPGHDKGFQAHDFRIGARYKFGKSGSCGAQTVHYTPEPYEPVYK